MNYKIFLFSFLFFVQGISFVDAAQVNPVIKATVVDVAGKPVKGAYLFFYDSSDIRRAVDLVSPVTNDKGYCEKAIPPGSYWVIARLKSDERFDMGPLMIEDKFSGDPMEIEVAKGETLELEFTVMDLLDTVKTKSKKRLDLFTLKGKVTNEKGEPLEGVFAYANRMQSPLSVPDYFSPWTEKDGGFTIFLPKGRYNLGAADSLSAKRRYKAVQEVVMEGDVTGITLILHDKSEAPVAK